MKALTYLCILGAIAALFQASFWRGYRDGYQQARTELTETSRTAYEDGYAEGYTKALSAKNDEAFRAGVVEGAIQTLCIYHAEGGEALERQVRILQGRAPK